MRDPLWSMNDLPVARPPNFRAARAMIWITRGQTRNALMAQEWEKVIIALFLAPERQKISRETVCLFPCWPTSILLSA